ncbi:MAG: hypothetical protein KDA32_10670 [Phycisphaerales bacterium]|nr:hypothetical protein [Phycisphaerales bacterium]
METERFANQKSRVFHMGADERTPVWRSVGSVTIVAPNLDEPLHLRGVGYTVFLQEARQEGELREALIFLRRIGRPAWQGILYWTLLGMFVGVAITRAWFVLANR